MKGYKEYFLEDKKDSKSNSIFKFGPAAGGALLAGTLLGGGAGAIGVGGTILAAKALHKLGKGIINRNKGSSSSKENNKSDLKNVSNVDDEKFNIKDHLNHPRRVADYISHGNASKSDIDMIVDHIDDHMKHNPASDAYRDALNTLGRMPNNKLSDNHAIWLSKHHQLLSTNSFYNLVKHPAFNDSDNINHFIINHDKRSADFVLEHKDVKPNQIHSLLQSNIPSVRNKANKILKGTSSTKNARNTNSSNKNQQNNSQQSNKQSPKDIDDFIASNEKNPSKLYSLLASGKRLQRHHINAIIAHTHKSLSTNKNSQYKPVLNKLAENPSLLSNENARFIGLHHQHLTNNAFNLLTSHGYFVKNSIGDLSNHNLRSVKFSLSRPGVTSEHVKYYLKSRDQDVQKYVQNKLRDYYKP